MFTSCDFRDVEKDYNKLFVQTYTITIMKVHI